MWNCILIWWLVVNNGSWDWLNEWLYTHNESLGEMARYCLTNFLNTTPREFANSSETWGFLARHLVKRVINCLLSRHWTYDSVGIPQDILGPWLEIIENRKSGDRLPLVCEWLALWYYYNRAQIFGSRTQGETPKVNSLPRFKELRTSNLMFCMLVYRHQNLRCKSEILVVIHEKTSVW